MHVTWIVAWNRQGFVGQKLRADGRLTRMRLISREARRCMMRPVRVEEIDLDAGWAAVSDPSGVRNAAGLGPSYPISCPELRRPAGATAVAV